MHLIINNRTNKIFQAVKLVAVLILITILAANAQAQNSSLVPQDTIDRAIILAKKIEREELLLNPPASLDEVNLDGLTGNEKLRALRFLSMDAAFFRNDLPPRELATIYRAEAVKLKSERDIAIAHIIGLQQDLQKADVKIEPGKSNLAKLHEFRSDADWFVAHRAALMESSLPMFKGSLDVGLKNALDALSLIPNELTDEVLEAQYETFDHISYLQLILNNIDLGVQTAEQVISKGEALDRSIDGISLINNMAYVFNSWHEYDTAEQLAAILLKLSRNPNGEISSLAYYRYGQAQSNAGHFDNALATLNRARDNTDEPKLIMGIESARAVALAGLGRTAEAEDSFVEYDRLSSIHGTDTKGFKQTRLRAQALIAINKNDAVETGRLQEERIKTTVQNFLTRQNKGIQSLQAELENSQDRQSEREAALVRETTLKQSELEAKQRSNMFLMALAGLLFFIAFCAIAFAIWRQKISKILEIAAHDAEAGDRAKSQFLSVMSHELRTPLNGIIGIAGILSERGETEELRNYNKLILKSGQNLLELLSGILDMAQMESDKLQIVTAPASIRQIVDGLYNAAKTELTSDQVEFTCFVSEDIPDDLMLDSLRVKQALSNLISNAVRFTDQGRIHIHITMGEPRRRGVRDLTMIVADTGQGIEQDIQDKLFKPFAQADSSLTRDHDGAGIGLAVTRGLSRLMGGDVTMTSKAGRGSEFTMVIKTCMEKDAKIDPVTNRRTFVIEPSAEPKIDFAPAVSLEKLRAKEAEKERNEFSNANANAFAGNESIDFDDVNDVEFETISEAPSISSDDDGDGTDVLAALGLDQPNNKTNPRSGFTRQHARADDDLIAPDQLQGLNILIVEDVPANQEVLRSLLEPVGCDVSCAEHGQKALDMMGAQIFDAVIMDIRMPVLDGIETTKAIRSLDGPHQNVAIIALTADASAANNAECLAAGADVFLTKPVIVSELFSSIRFARRKQYRQKQQALSA